MPRRLYYSVPPSAWLHTRQRDQGFNTEESVRQWCAQELIRGYGICVTDLDFEAKSQVGSKTYRIDILVRREGKPWIVVECKQLAHRAHQNAMEQAVSYADSPRIQAEFAVYTNGDVWLVKRRLGSHWVSSIDLPPLVANGGSSTAVEVHLKHLEDLMAAARMLDEDIRGRTAVRFLETLQCLFNGSHGWCHACDGLLLDAADNLLRSIVGFRYPNYPMGKLLHATEQVRGFVKTRAANCLFPPQPSNPGTMQEELQWLESRLHDLQDNLDQSQTPDGYLIRLLHSLTSYARTISLRAWRAHYPRIPTDIHTNLRAFLDMALKIHFHLALPDMNDPIGMADLRKLCEGPWRTFDQE